MWVDTSKCEQTFHHWTRVGNDLVCLHSDDTECEATEYDLARETEEP